MTTDWHAWCSTVIAGASVLLLAGCTTSFGAYGIQSRYIEPNSNVRPTGPAYAEMSHTTFIIAPTISREDLIQTYEEAVASVPGSDALIDYIVDYDITTFLGFTTVKLKLSGTAVEVEGGLQPLH